MTIFDAPSRPGATPGLPADLDWPDFPSSGLPPVEPRGRKARVRAVALLALAVSTAYLTWRLLATMSGTTLWLSVPLVLLELHGIVSLAFHTVDLWDLDRRPPQRSLVPAPSVAVLVPTYSEPREVLLPTVAAAVAMGPAHETWVLDDGDRAWVREMAADLGAHYRARPTHEHAKAGNINAVLGELEARGVDLLAVLDADHVVRSDFLHHTLGYFTDPRMALVQTPQDFYNLDSFEHADRPGGKRFAEQELFYRGLAAGRNRWNAAFWCGTNAVVRLAALRDVGGVATDTVTEDIHTTIRMHRRGWHTAYHNEVLARGLAAADADQYLAQRQRWGTGAMQVLRTENPAFVRGLRIGQRVSYLSTLLGWFDSWRTLGFVLLPILTVASGGLPINASAPVFAVAFGLTFVLQRFALTALDRGRATLRHATLFEFVRLPANLRATMALFTGGTKTFTVTAKGRSGDNRTRMRVPRLMWLLLALSAVSFAWYVASIWRLTPMRYDLPWVAHGAAFWLLVNAMFVGGAVGRIRQQRFGADRRAAVRFDLGGVIDLDGVPARLVDISLTGAQVAVTGLPLQVGQHLVLHLPVGDEPLALLAVVRSVRPGITIQAGLELEGAASADLARLALALFRTGIAPTLVAVDGDDRAA